MVYYIAMRKISTFSERLKIAMDLNAISANALASSLSINKSIISRYLSGKMLPRQDRLDQIATFFHVSHAWLMGYDCEMYVDDVKTAVIKSLENLSKDELIEVYYFIKTLAEAKK